MVRGTRREARGESQSLRRNAALLEYGRSPVAPSDPTRFAVGFPRPSSLAPHPSNFAPRPPHTIACPGFTLVEVLVALAIVAVALIACMRAAGVMTLSGSELKVRMLAQLSARNQIAVMRATQAFPSPGVTSTPCPQGNVDLVCRQETKGTPNEFFRRVEISVRLASEPDRYLAQMVGILPREQ
jgi:general secretion pathway protein I